MPEKTRPSNFPRQCLEGNCRGPTSIFRRNSTPHVFHDLAALLDGPLSSSLNGGDAEGQPGPPIFEYRSNTTGVTPLRTRDIGACEGPRDLRPRRQRVLPVRTTLDMSGFQPCLKCLVRDVFLDGARCSPRRIAVISAWHAPLAQPVLGADSAAHFPAGNSSGATSFRPPRTACRHSPAPASSECNCEPGTFHSQKGLPHEMQRPAWA